MASKMKTRGAGDAGALFETIRVGATNTRKDIKNPDSPQCLRVYRVHENLLVTPIHDGREVGHE